MRFVAFCHARRRSRPPARGPQTFTRPWSLPRAPPISLPILPFRALSSPRTPLLLEPRAFAFAFFSLCASRDGHQLDLAGGQPQYVPRPVLSLLLRLRARYLFLSPFIFCEPIEPIARVGRTEYGSH